MYVDDLIISGNDASAVDHFKAYLHECFHMKDLGVQAINMAIIWQLYH